MIQRGMRHVNVCMEVNDYDNSLNQANLGDHFHTQVFRMNVFGPSDCSVKPIEATVSPTRLLVVSSTGGVISARIARNRLPNE